MSSEEKIRTHFFETEIKTSTAEWLDEGRGEEGRGEEGKEEDFDGTLKTSGGICGTIH